MPKSSILFGDAKVTHIILYRTKTLPQILKNILKIFLPFAFGIGILWWMYRDTDWSHFVDAVFHQMHWGWMALSLLFGILPSIIRALRWQIALAPLDEHPRRRTCINSIFLSYASSLVVPRIGEVTRCGTLKKGDGTSFTKSLGTVVSERMVDSLVIVLLTVIVFINQSPVLLNFLTESGTDIDSIVHRFTGTGYLVTFLCAIAIVILVFWLVARFKIFSKGKDIMRNVWAGITSLRYINRAPLYIFYSFAIWICYYLHFYIAFFCFDFTSHIDPIAAFLIFCVGSFAVLVPTPNGAGPWHFAVKTMLVIYGVAEQDAILFALAVHTIQTAEVILLGVYGWADFNMQSKFPRPTAKKTETLSNDESN